MARQDGTLKLSSNIEPIVAAPLDARTKTANLADLVNPSILPYAYVGMEVYVESEQKKYMLVGDDPTNSSNWIENGGSGKDIQVEVMPTASVSEVGNIYQYVGATTTTLTNGYFYKCVSNGEDPATYSWENIDIQETSGVIIDVEELPEAPNIKNVIYRVKYKEDRIPRSSDETLESYSKKFADVTKWEFTDITSDVYTIEPYSRRSSYYDDIIWYDWEKRKIEKFKISQGSSSSSTWAVVEWFYYDDGELHSNTQRIGKIVDTFYIYQYKCTLYQGDEVNQELKEIKLEKNYIFDNPSEMYNSAGPTALGKIYQYFGDTMGKLINGYFYKCVKDRDVLPAYSWENVQVQEGTSGSQTLSELDDVTITDPTNNQILKYDAVNEIWVNSTDDEGQTIQLEELPERWDESEIEENAIYQYIGETYRGTTYSGEHIDYKNGYFYKATKVTNIPFIQWKELYGTKDWSELDRSVKRNYFPSIEFEATLPDSGFDVEIQKDGTFIVNSKTGTIQDNILFWEGTTIPAGEYILCTELLSGTLSLGSDIYISVKNETTSESELAEISSNISHPFKAGGSLIINEGDTIKFRIYATGHFTTEKIFKFHVLFQQFSIVDRSWQPADMLDNVELSNKIPDTSKMINIFTGTQAEWDALTTEEKLAYKQVNITDDESDPSVVVDAVTDGDMHAVTSNAVYDEFKKVQSQTYECSGYLINSIADEIQGYGRATVFLRDGVAEIRFSARIQANNMTPTFSWGLNRDLLHTLLPDLPIIAPVSTNSNLQFFSATGSVLVDLMGYGGMAVPTYQFWTPARMYQIDGTMGSWGSDQFPVNSYITGTVYGLYTV